MGRFKADGVMVKELPNLTIIFWDSKSIYVYPRGQRGVIFHRWYAPKGSYTGGWGDFRRRIMRRRHLNVYEIYRMADRYGILHVGTDRQLDLSKVKIRKRGYYR